MDKRSGMPSISRDHAEEKSRNGMDQSVGDVRKYCLHGEMIDFWIKRVEVG